MRLPAFVSLRRGKLCSFAANHSGGSPALRIHAEELDFILNYDIEYHLGRDTETEEG